MLLWIEDMRDVEIVRDDGDRIAVGDVVLDPDFGPAIEGDDECGDDDEPAAVILFQASPLLKGPGLKPLYFLFLFTGLKAGASTLIGCLQGSNQPRSQRSQRISLP